MLIRTGNRSPTNDTMVFLQLANSWGRGVDKLPFKERRQFCERNLHNILDSASHPLDDTASR